MSQQTETNKQALPETRQMSRSVKGPEDGEIVRFFLPYLDRTGGSLPPTLPRYYPRQYYSPIDLLLISTLSFDDTWSTAVGNAIDKIAAKGWEVNSEIPLRRKAAQHWLKEAGAGNGLFGFSKFIPAHLGGYILTGKAFIEIERTTPAKGSKIINIHHLNPLRCYLTGNNRRPVNYLCDDGKERSLEWWQVIIITDKLYPSRYGGNRPQGAAERAYHTIRKKSSIENFIDEKVSGRRPLALDFVGGLSKSALDKILGSSQHEADSKGLRSYMGAAIVAIPGDTPITNVRIPIAELPDITDVDRERTRADLTYANAIGLDPQDVNPQLVGRQGLGSTGNQSEVLKNKQRGRGLAKWQKEFTEELNKLALDDSTTFTFSENDLQDQQVEADIAKKRADTQKVYIDTGITTAVQSKNLLVDAGDLPPEFLEQDATGADTLRDSQKPDTPEERAVRAARPEMEKPKPKEEEKKEPQTEKERGDDIWDEVYH